MRLANRTILIISPQAWGQMYISKHHYAIALAKMGNRVYFLNPPEQNSSKKAGNIAISNSCVHHNLLLIDHTLNFPFILKYHAIKVFHILMAFHVKNILREISKPVDIVWSFDQGNLFPFKLFDKNSFKIFQPVDEPKNNQAIKAAIGADVILSVTREILTKYSSFKQPKHLINHGIGEDFLLPCLFSPLDTQKIHVGFSGNLLRPDIDHKVLLKIIKQNPDVVFECWGGYRSTENNIGGMENVSTRKFITALQQSGVILHGAIHSRDLAGELQRMDAFLICYDVIKDQSKGTNYHKIMEFLSAGKIIIANNVTAYKDMPDLVQMVRSRTGNQGLPRLFKKVIQNLQHHNSPAMQQKRKDFASANTYNKHVGRIEGIIGELMKVA